jgi:hypothetical protein
VGWANLVARVGTPPPGEDGDTDNEGPAPA